MPLSPRGALSALILVVALVGVGGLAAGASPKTFQAGQPEGCAKPNRSMDLYAVELPRDRGQIRLGYGRTPETASYPGPTIEMMEGECLAITLHNQVPIETLTQLRAKPEYPLGVSLHVHGVKYTEQSDGTAHSNSFVPPGESRTYTWYAKKPDKRDGSPGTAGYWWYHDHVVGTPHGTQGVASGLFGAVIVRRPGDPKPAHTYVVAFGNQQTINLRRAPDTDTCDAHNPQPGPTCMVARQGERVEFVVISTGNDMHTFHLHGHAWANTRTGLLGKGDDNNTDSVPVIDNRTVGPADSFGFQVKAGDSVGPGHWMLHCHVQFHSDIGMTTTFHVLNKDGSMPPHDMTQPMAVTPSPSAS
ncbi:multicopper oxidase domain-containing protein [Planosporangium flavigriseum]|nr:multicopper oxidase domain-containing protein [Planosporangium flavigriseum]